MLAQFWEEFCPFSNTHAITQLSLTQWDIHMHLMDWTLTMYEAENRILMGDYLSGVIQSNLAPSVFKSSLRGCITSLLFANTREQQQ